MAFLDNIGDIILDAVLTDTGRMRLAKGDGSFKISKFALADDEIDYTNFNKAHSSGSAYYDLEVLQTPVLEAFTNNTSAMKSKLLSVSRTNLLYLPVIKLNLKSPGGVGSSGKSGQYSLGSPALNMHTVLSDNDTNDKFSAGFAGGAQEGALQGYVKEGVTQNGNYIRIDQGLDTNEIAPKFRLDPDLMETQYILEIDNRLGKIAAAEGALSNLANVSFIDDDNIASYYLSEGTNPMYVKMNNVTETSDAAQTIRGPRGTFLQFRIMASIDLQNSYYLFEQLGTKKSAADSATIYGITNPGGNGVHHIDTTVRITGATTGYRIDIPIRFVRWQSS